MADFLKTIFLIILATSPIWAWILFIKLHKSAKGKVKSKAIDSKDKIQKTKAYKIANTAYKPIKSIGTLYGFLILLFFIAGWIFYLTFYLIKP